MITLRQLRYLDALAETLHFGEAAEACAVSQPALSMQIRELEEVLEVSLVERRKSGVELTEQGEEIVKRGRTILSSVRDLLDYAKHRERVLSGTLKLGVIPSIAPYLLPDALPELQRRFPELNLQLRETITETLVHELGSGVLAHERLLLLEEGHCLRDQALSFCRLVTPEARESFGASSLATVVQMVAHGYGITLLPEMAVASEVHDRKDIRLQHFPAPEPKREVGLAWRKTSPRKADFHAFAALLKDAGRHRVKS
jgi:LysR family hydrogen peroxide-inducible transcriptional activator